ncbi:MAG: DUF2779 domain-containing protein [Betaproteobacteria bacterium]|nr:DUF2779 domain-containing protein [Betaproteobacteria bacterium]
MPRPRLSKNKLLSFLQCSKRLWLEVNEPDAAEISSQAARGLVLGHNVGEVARGLLPEGILIGHDQDFAEALSQTQMQLSAGSRVLFEAAFQHEDLLIRADILMRDSRGEISVTEVKAPTSVKDYHLSDAAIQAWVIRNAGLDVNAFTIGHIDTNFIYPGNGHYQGLFRYVPVDKEIEPLRNEVPKWMERARRVLSQGEPAIDMGSQCQSPFSCPFQDYCSAHAGLVEYHVTILPRGGKTVRALLSEGYRDLGEVPKERLLSENHAMVWRASVSGLAQFHESVRPVMQAFPYPRYFMDFETINPAITFWEGTTPYRQLPFQWSCHIESEDGRVEHREFLDTSGGAPMKAFLVSLLPALGTQGPIFVYYASFERSRLEELAAMFPEFQDPIAKVIGSIEDLHPLTKSHYYHPSMKGSWSLKSVMPAIDPAMDYAHLEDVRDGGGAQEAYMEIIAPGTPEDRKTKLTQSLKRYCARDTEALVRLAHFLERGK